jgi:hypothetical protein
MIDRKLCASVSMFKGDSDRTTIKKIINTEESILTFV